MNFVNAAAMVNPYPYFARWTLVRNLNISCCLVSCGARRCRVIVAGDKRNYCYMSWTAER